MSRDWWAEEVHHGVDFTRQLNLVALVMLHDIEHGYEPEEPTSGWGRPYRAPHPHDPMPRKSTPAQLRTLERHRVRGE